MRNKMVNDCEDMCLIILLLQGLYILESSSSFKTINALLWLYFFENKKLFSLLKWTFLNSLYNQNLSQQCLVIGG